MKKLVFLVLLFVGYVCGAFAQEINIDIHKQDRIRNFSIETSRCIYEATRTFIALRRTYVGARPFVDAMCKAGIMLLKKEWNFASEQLWQEYYTKFSYIAIRAAVTDVDPTITADWPDNPK